MTIDPIVDVSKAVRLLVDGRLVVFPTETVYGLGGRVDNDHTIETIFAAKGRPADNPLIVHVASVEMARRYAIIGPVEEALFDAFAPGPLTVVCPVRQGSLSRLVTGGGPTVAVRIPESEIALDLIEGVDCGLAAPSANRSGRPSPTDAEHACEEMDGRVAAVLDGGPCRVGIESTVAYWSGNTVTVLRPGAITEEALNAVAADLASERLTGDSPGDESQRQSDSGSAGRQNVQSPGTRYRHYAPRVPVYLFTNTTELPRNEAGDLEAGIACVCGEETAAALSVAEKRSVGPTIIAFRSSEMLSANLYRWLWKLEGSASAIWIELPGDTPESKGLRDRLLRAAERDG